MHSKAPSAASKAVSHVSKVASVASKQPSHSSRVTIKSKAPSAASRGSQSLAKSGLAQLAGVASYKSSSIRTTTTTRERLAEIERQLEMETKKRIAAERAIVELTRNGHKK